MPRSASTLLYNAVRLLLLDSIGEEKLQAGWIEDLRETPRLAYNLIKIHRYEEELITSSCCILHSYRDIRDVVLSNNRKFGFPVSMIAIENIVANHEKWGEVADVSLRYELIRDSPLEMLRHVEENLISKSILSEKHKQGFIRIRLLARRLQALNYASRGEKNERYHVSNQFHKNHITDGRSELWRTQLDHGLSMEVKEKYAWWFEKHGYPLC